jgi:hypothetical protein
MQSAEFHPTVSRSEVNRPELIAFRFPFRLCLAKFALAEIAKHLRAGRRDFHKVRHG